MRIGTISLGRIGALGECYNSEQSYGVCPDGSDYLGTLDNGGAAIDVSTLPNYAAEATAAGVGTPTSAIYMGLPVSTPAVFAPTGVKASATGLQTTIQCPSGYTQSGGVCVQAVSSSLITGVPNSLLYAGLGFLLIMSLNMQGRRR